MGMRPHHLCCGCCCELETGAPIGVALLLLLHLIFAVLGMISATQASMSYATEAAAAFCSKTSAEYREGYDECYGSDICDVQPDWDGAYSASQAAPVMTFVGTLLIVIALGWNLIATLKRAERGLLAVHISWRALLVFPAWFLLTAIVDAALTSRRVQVVTAVDYYQRSAADRFCNEAAGTDDLPYIEGFHTSDVDCKNNKEVGYPEDEDSQGPGGVRGCDTEGTVAIFVVLSFAWTVAVDVVLLGVVIFNVYSLGCKLQGQAGSATAMSETELGARPPVAIATAVAVPAIAVATAVATPAVAVAVAVATPTATAMCA